jgi:hypothetical protein
MFADDNPEIRSCGADDVLRADSGLTRAPIPAWPGSIPEHPGSVPRGSGQRSGAIRARTRRVGLTTVDRLGCHPGSKPSAARGAPRAAATGMVVTSGASMHPAVDRGPITTELAWRRRLGQDGALLGTLTRLFVQTVHAFYTERAAASGVTGAKTGAVTVVQRTSSDLRLNSPS